MRYTIFNMNFFWAVGASIVISAISLIGVIALILKEKVLEKLLFSLVAFSAGTMIGGAFLHLLPDAFERCNAGMSVFYFVLIGFVSFFMLEKFFYWRHCHEGKCDVHAFTYLNLIGDGIHNFVDGIMIGTSFVIDVRFGIITTLIILFHEIPQELGDFGVLVYGGFKKSKALLFNLIFQSTAIIGTIIGYRFSNSIENFSCLFLSFAAGGFIYIASCDLIPELHKQPDSKKAIISMAFFLLGILFIFLMKIIFPH